jgi:hypothetical protein
MTPRKLPGATALESLCLCCGLCCDGTLFKDVQLQPGDDVIRLRAIGLPVRVSRSVSSPKFPQPCAALAADCRCGIYAERPVYCRQFECGLFKAVASRRLKMPAGLRLIRLARHRADKVRVLLRRLGDDDDHLPLSRRFHRIRQRFELATPDSKVAGLFGQLTVAIQKLNVLLVTEFYPGRVK